MRVFRCGLAPGWLWSISSTEFWLVRDSCTATATPPDPVVHWPLSLPLTQLWNSVYCGRYSWKNTLSCLASVSLVSVNTIIHGFLWCAICLSSSGTVVEPMTFHVNTVKVSQQGVYAPATFFFSFVVTDCLFVWLVVLSLLVSDSLLASPSVLSQCFPSLCCRPCQSPLVAGAFLCQQQWFPWLVAFGVMSGFSY